MVEVVSGPPRWIDHMLSIRVLADAGVERADCECFNRP